MGLNYTRRRWTILLPTKKIFIRGEYDVGNTKQPRGVRLPWLENEQGWGHELEELDLLSGLFQMSSLNSIKLL